jgi:hypothetical protein
MPRSGKKCSLREPEPTERFSSQSDHSGWLFRCVPNLFDSFGGESPLPRLVEVKG